MYILTDEGKKYLKEGFPEVSLLKLVASKGSLNIKDVSIDNKGVAISWAKKNGWIKVEKGEILLTEKGTKALDDKYYFDELLKKVDSGENITEEEAKQLFSRNLIREVKEIPNIEEIAQLTPEIIISGIWKSKPFKKYDVTVPAPELYIGKKHPYVQFIEEVKEKLVEMGFEEIKSPYVETEFWNFDALFVPQDHPAREWSDVLTVKGNGELPEIYEKVEKTHKDGWITGSKGWGFWKKEISSKLVLRSHTTPASVRYLAKMNVEEAKVFTIDRVFRRDVIDKTHLMEFDQAEGIIVGKNITFRHLLGILKEFAKKVLDTDKVKFRPSYFPFTEPSVEMDVYSKELRKWVEIVGAGMFRPEVLKPLGVKNPVAAWGFGFSRLAMIKLGIEDIRYLFAKDLEWLRTYPVMRCLL